MVDLLSDFPKHLHSIQVMCVQYWPAGKNKEEAYSGVGVTVENEEQIANFMIRTIRLQKVTCLY